MNRGWQCPGCGRCYAPWKATCHHCPPVKSVGSSNTDAFTLDPEQVERVKRAMQQAAGKTPRKTTSSAGPMTHGNSSEADDE